MPFRSDIQGLRAAAVIPVVLFHFGMGIVPGGFTGVDMFFCISGFVIAGSVLGDLRAGRFTIADFYFKRIRRIFPALGVVLIATTVAATALLLPDDLVGYHRSLLATGTFWSNVYFWKESGYFAAAARTQPLLHTWSLSIEEQFYVVAPIAFALIHRYGRERWLVFLAPIAVLSFLASVAAVFTAPTAGFFLLPTRAWELLVGAVLALHAWPPPRHRIAREVLAWTGTVSIATGMLLLHENDPFPGWNALFPVVGAALVIYAGSGGGAPTSIARVLSTAPMRSIGNISYSLYLIHWPIAALRSYATLSPPTVGEAATMFAFSIGLAALSWRFVEEPWRHLARARRTRVFLVGGAMMAAVAAVATAGIVMRGYPSRFPGYVHREITGSEQWGGSHCFNTDPTRPLDWDAVACTRVRGRHGRILLWGDSFAAQYTPGILTLARRIDADVLQYTFAGCPPILAYSSLARVGCARSNRRVPDLIRAQGIDTVVISARWTETPRRTLRRLHETIAALRSLGVRVVVFGQSPQFVVDVQHIDFLSNRNHDRRRGRWPVSFGPELNRMIAVEARGVTFVDPVAMLCDGDTCPYRIGSDYLYTDFGHFSTAGSRVATARYFPSGQ